MATKLGDYLATSIPSELRATGLFDDGIMSPPEIGTIEAFSVLNLTGILAAHRARLKDKFRIYVSPVSVPDAKVVDLDGGKSAAIVLTQGYISAIAILASRLAVVHTMSNWMSSIRREGPSSMVETEFGELGDFDLSSLKRRAVGLDATREYLCSLLKLECIRQVAVAFACSALEFCLLHEIGHVLCAHFRARQSGADRATEITPFVGDLPGQRLHPFKNPLQRQDEHEADAFALQLMFASPMPRLGLLSQYGVLLPFSRDTSLRLLAYVGGALNFALLTLLSAHEPTDGGLKLPDKIEGSHPLPHVRLRIADFFFRWDLQDRQMLKRCWPGAPREWNKLLGHLQAESMIGALSILQASWPNAIDSDDPLMLHRQFILLLNREFEELVGKDFWNDGNIRLGYLRKAVASDDEAFLQDSPYLVDLYLKRSALQPFWKRWLPSMRRT